VIRQILGGHAHDVGRRGDQDEPIERRSVGHRENRPGSAERVSDEDDRPAGIPALHVVERRVDVVPEMPDGDVGERLVPPVSADVEQHDLEACPGERLAEPQDRPVARPPSVRDEEDRTAGLSGRP
jgi:hypothetical protein